MRPIAHALFVAMLCSGFGAGCYTVQLTPITAPTIAGGPIPVPATVDIPAQTASSEKVIRSGMAGFANTWTVEVGRAVDQYAHAYLNQAFPPGEDVTVQVDLVGYDVKGFAATTDLRMTVNGRRGTLFQRDYRGVGDAYGGRVVLGGAFAMKSALRRTTDESLRSCFEQFLTDARVEYPAWRNEAGVVTGQANPPPTPE